MNQNETTTLTEKTTKGAKRGKMLRPDCRLLEPEEMTPEERWDEIAELLTIMALPKNGKKLTLAEDGLDVESQHAL